MKKLTQKNAKEYALNKFKQLSELPYQWNVMHSKGIIEILDKLISDEKFNKEKLFALAWIHDTGKIKSIKNHAEVGVEILKKEFELDEIDIDCILRHGSSSEPKTKEGKVFRYSDGLSLFLPEVIKFKFYAEDKEGKSFDEIKDGIENMYEKYKESYSDSKEVLDLLDKLFQDIVYYL